MGRGRLNPGQHFGTPNFFQKTDEKWPFANKKKPNTRKREEKPFCDAIWICALSSVGGSRGWIEGPRLVSSRTDNFQSHFRWYNFLFLLWSVQGALPTQEVGMCFLLERFLSVSVSCCCWCNFYRNIRVYATVELESVVILLNVREMERLFWWNTFGETICFFFAYVTYINKSEGSFLPFPIPQVFRFRAADDRLSHTPP